MLKLIEYLFNPQFNISLEASFQTRQTFNFRHGLIVHNLNYLYSITHVFPLSLLISLISISTVLYN